MIRSMTGYGNFLVSNQKFDIKIEIKTINSKNLDIQFYYPKHFSSQELQWRNLISNRLIRGKIHVFVDLTFHEVISSELSSVNKDVFKANYDFLLSLDNMVSSNSSSLFDIALKNTLKTNSSTNQQVLNDDDLKLIADGLSQALNSCDNTRLQEGKCLHKEFLKYIEIITRILNKINEIKSSRVSSIKSRLMSKIMELDMEYDKGRLEQEMLFYIEKLDIEEEVVRLDKHIKYFITVLNSDAKVMNSQDIDDLYDKNMSLPSNTSSEFRDINNTELCKGKKLGFILQEMNREVNTIGSKSNNDVLQKYVVQMKEQIEKIKEQLYNIL